MNILFHLYVPRTHSKALQNSVSLLRNPGWNVLCFIMCSGFMFPWQNSGWYFLCFIMCSGFILSWKNSGWNVLCFVMCLGFMYLWKNSGWNLLFHWVQHSWFLGRNQDEMCCVSLWVQDSCSLYKLKKGKKMKCVASSWVQDS